MIPVWYLVLIYMVDRGGASVAIPQFSYEMCQRNRVYVTKMEDMNFGHLMRAYCIQGAK